MELVEFLLARIAEDEQVARDAGSRGTTWDVAIQRPVEWGEDWPDTDIVAGGKPILRNNVEYAGINEVEHVVTWDPARVLAECDAKRRIVNASRAGFPDKDRYAMGWHDFHVRALCLLALPYADHPDYREEWRP